MKILFDGHIYNSQKAGGIGRYFNSIIRRLPGHFVPILTTLDSKSTFDLPAHQNLDKINFNSFKPYRVFSFSKKKYFSYINRIKKYELVHPTYYTLLSEEKFSSLKKPVVSTIHDMIFELFEDQLKNAKIHMAYKRDAIESSEILICVSNNTKKDLLRFYPHVEDKIRVIYEGTEIKFADSFGDEKTPVGPYFLCVGGRHAYKNFTLILDSFPKVLEHGEVKLCIVGPPLTEEENKAIASSGLRDHIEFYGFVTNSHLAKLYRLSLALVYPSLYEGFGLPPLEAMSCGTPVIASNLSSIPEVVGDAGILINPDHKDELPEAMISFLKDNSLRELYIEKGFRQAKLFDWDKNIIPIIDIYNSFSS